MTTWFDLTRVSHATRLLGSCARQASRTLSEIRSATLSGWPSPTDSEENTNDFDMGFRLGGQDRTGLKGSNASLISTYLDFVMRPISGARILPHRISLACGAAPHSHWYLATNG